MEITSEELKSLREEIAALRRGVARLEGMLGVHRNIAAPALPLQQPSYQPIYPGGPWPAVCGYGAVISSGIESQPYNAARKDT